MFLYSSVGCLLPAQPRATTGFRRQRRGCCPTWITGSVLDPRIGVQRSASFRSVLLVWRATSRRAARQSRPRVQNVADFCALCACTCTGFCARPPCSYHPDLPDPVSSLQLASPMQSRVPLPFLRRCMLPRPPRAPGVPTETSAVTSPVCRRLSTSFPTQLP